MNVPNLRFKGFSGDWKRILFKTLFEERNERTGDMEKYPLYSLTVAEGITPKTDRYKRDFLVKKDENFKIVHPNDFVFNPMNMTIGALGLFTENKAVSVSGYYNVFRNISNYKNFFLVNYLKSNKMIWKYKSIATGSLIEKQRVHYSQFIELKELLPSTEEAAKISDFLELIDKKLQLQQEKIDLLNEQKKGYMQQIFEQSQSTWSLVKLQNVFEERSEKGYIEYNLLAVTIRHGVTDRADMKKDTSSEDKSNYKRVLPGDIAYNSMRMWQGASGRSQYAGIVSPAYTILKPKENVDSLFFAYLFKTDRMLYEFKKYSQGLTSDTWNLKYPLLKDIKVKIPSYVEQKRISNFFAKVDKKIQLEQQKLEILQQQKKGFIQQMFI